MRRSGASADDQIVDAKKAHESQCVVRRVLTVGIEDEDVFAGCIANPGFDRGAVAFVVRMFDHARTRCRGHEGRFVRGSIIDDEQLAPGCRGTEGLHNGTHRSCLFIGWNDHADGRRICHACEIVSRCEERAKV